MASVRTETTIFGDRFVARFNVDKNGVFSVKLPDWSHAALGKSEIKGKTLSEVEKLFQSERERYAKIRQSTSEVILYKFELQDKTGAWNGDKDERDDMSFGIGKGIQFAVCNALETQHYGVDGELVRRSYKTDPDQPYPLGYDYGKFGSLVERNLGFQVMEWTQDREDWFLNLCKAMDGLISKIKTLDEQQVLLLSAIQDRKLLSFS